MVNIHQIGDSKIGFCLFLLLDFCIDKVNNSEVGESPVVIILLDVSLSLKKGLICAGLSFLAHVQFLVQSYYLSPLYSVETHSSLPFITAM